MKRQVMVDRCVCHDVPFTTLLQWATDRTSTTVNDVRDTFGCSSSCGMCRRYIEEALSTGCAKVPLRLQQERAE